MEDHSSLRYSDGEDDKTDREVSSILLELSHPVVISYDSSPCSLKWGRTKKRTFSDIMPPPKISSEPVIKPQPITEVSEMGSNSSTSSLTGEAKKTNPQSSQKGLDEECFTYLELKQKTSSQPSASCPVLEIQADTGLSRAQAVAPPAQPIAEKGRRITTNGQNLRPLRPLMIRVDRTANARHNEAAALLLEARLNMERRGLIQEPINKNMERRNFDLEPRRNNINMERRNFDLQPRNNNMEWLRFDLESRNNNMERGGFNLDPKNNNMERRGFNLEASHNMERRGFGLEPRNNKMEWLRFDLEASHNMERRGFEDLQASRNKTMEWLRFDLMARQNNMERRGVDLEARNNNVEPRGFDLNLPATEEVNHRDTETVESQRAAAIKEHQQAAAEARQRRLGLRRAKKLQNSRSISPNK